MRVLRSSYSSVRNRAIHSFIIRAHCHRKTFDLIRQVEQAGVAWITVHGRTVRERTRVPVHLDAIKEARCTHTHVLP
jgi:tRNA-dihydrouridine synthase 4